jgi:sugar phosphate isomerase/epimerase
MNTLLQTPRRVSVSTWALHPLLGTVTAGRPGDPNARMMEPHAGDGTTTLLDVPRELAAHGIQTMELCHFHLLSRDPAYLAELRAAREAAGVELWNLLIDDGDIVHPEHGERDWQWIHGWLDTAADLGARCVRVIAGKQPPTEETLALSRDRLLSLMVDAYLRGVHVMTENWFATLPTPNEVNTLLESCNGSIGLCLDFGNWSGPTKYDDLAEIAPLAISSHAKCQFKDGEPDTEDYHRCLDLMKEADYSGPFTIVHGEPGRVWESIAQQRDLITPYL